MKILDKKRSIFLFGARGTGKTSLLDVVLTDQPNVFRIDLLRGDAFQRYASRTQTLGDEIDYLITKNSPQTTIVAIDEVQKLPSLLDEVHSLIEKHKKLLAFVLTGSSARKLRRGGANLLAGRAITCYLHPLSSMELDIDLARAMQFGTLPAIYLDSEGLEISTLASYVGTYLREEIQAESLVRQVDRFTRFLDIAVQLNGEPVNFTKLGRQCNLSVKTVQEYYSIVCDTLICTRIDGWSQSVKLQLLQAPKFYFFDCGVINAITGELRSELKPASFRYGRLFETFVIQEMIRCNDYLDLGLRLNHWRDKDGREVDVIISRSYSRPLVGIEVKSNTHPLPEDFHGLRIFHDDYPQTALWCLCNTPHAYRSGDIEVMPWQQGLERIAAL